MFARLRAAIRDWRSFGPERDRAWAPFLVVLDDGRTRFQAETETRVIALLARRGLQLANRRFGNSPSLNPGVADGSLFVEAEIPALCARIWLYDDQTEISAPGRELNLERWGVNTPEEHISIVEEFLEDLADAPDAV